MVMKALIHFTLSVSFTFFCLSSLAQNTYVWTGTSSTSYSDPTNWSPERSTPHATDELVFDNGQNIEVTDVTTETIGALKVENTSQVVFSAAVVNKILSISDLLIIENGASLTFKKPNGVKMDVEMNDTAEVEIGGQVMVEKGIVDFNNATVTLYGNQQPLSGAKSSYSFGVGSTLQFGKAGATSGQKIILPDDILVGNPAIGTLIINSEAGVQFGNQFFTITDVAKFVSGDLETNNQGYLKFAPQAQLPAENSSSKIVGFAEMLPRDLGYDSISFLGYSISEGHDDLGNVSIVRSTGAANFSKDAESIAVTWDVNVDRQPEQGRNITMQWFSDFDNGIDINNPLQMYRYTNGTEWEIVGGATYLAANKNGLRTSAAIITNHFSEWTMGDGLNNALPVSLIRFTGKSSDSGIYLNWSTASELNNDKFLVERLIEGDFKVVGTIKGKGTSSSLSQYDFADINPDAGTNYYRLTQVDFDGKQTSFETIAVQHDLSTEFEMYPNPTTGDHLNINLAGEVKENASVRLYNSNGILLIDKKLAGNISMNVLEGQKLSGGLYYLEIANGGTSQKRRVIVR